MVFFFKRSRSSDCRLYAVRRMDTTLIKLYDTRIRMHIVLTVLQFTTKENTPSEHILRIEGDALARNSFYVYS